MSVMSLIVAGIRRRIASGELVAITKPPRTPVRRKRAKRLAGSVVSQARGDK